MVLLRKVTDFHLFILYQERNKPLFVLILCVCVLFDSPLALLGNFCGFS